jgi:hypothetical protein
MKTFKHIIPARTFELHGGNLMKNDVVLSNDLMSSRYTIITRDKNSLNVVSKDSAHTTKIHLDMCWTVVNVVID